MKRKYNVYRVYTYYTEAEQGETQRKEFIGSTFAVSPEKAESNVAYRTGRRVFDVTELGCGEMCIAEFKAEEA